jgi:valyl-tRNA synthetase
VQLLVRGEVAAMPLKGVVDLAAERVRLEKELKKFADDIDRVDKKFTNADFMARAPEEVVDEQREKRAEAEDRQRKIKEALERLRDAI